MQKFNDNVICAIVMELFNNVVFISLHNVELYSILEVVDVNDAIYELIKGIIIARQWWGSVGSVGEMLIIFSC